MLRSNRSIRFTSREIDELRALGIDLGSVRSREDFAVALEPWLQALADVRPDVFDRFTREIAAAKGVPLPRDRA